MHLRPGSTAEFMRWLAQQNSVVIFLMLLGVFFVFALIVLLFIAGANRARRKKNKPKKMGNKRKPRNVKDLMYLPRVPNSIDSGDMTMEEIEHEDSLEDPETEDDHGE